MASALNADLAILSFKKTEIGRTAQVMVTNLKEGIKLDINIMLLGDSQAGKSTMVCELRFFSVKFFSRLVYLLLVNLTMVRDQPDSKS